MYELDNLEEPELIEYFGSGEGSTPGDNMCEIINGRFEHRIIEYTAHHGRSAAIDILYLIIFEGASFAAFDCNFIANFIKDVFGDILMKAHHRTGHHVGEHHSGGDIEIMKEIIPISLHRYSGRSGEIILMRESHHRALLIEGDSGHAVHCVKGGKRDSHSGEALGLVVFIQVCECKVLCHNKSYLSANKVIPGLKPV